MINDPDKLEIEKLIDLGFERKNIDYKADFQWNKETKFELIKDIISFANAGGGNIIIGVKESQRNEKDKYEGISEENLKTWEVTSVSRDVNNYCSPSIDIELVEVDHSKWQKKFVVIRIPSHGRSPHLCVKDKNDKKGNLVLRKAAIYLRDKNKSCGEISDPFELEALIRRCTKSDSDHLLKEISQIVSGSLSQREPINVNKIDPFDEMDNFAKRTINENPILPEELDE